MDVIDIRVESRILTGSDDDWGGTNEDIGGIDLSAPMAAFEIPMF